jgi:hypothetical protein
MENEKGSGWTLFAAVMLMFAGVMRLFDAVWAFNYTGAAPRLRDAVLGESISNYGWWWLLSGAVLIGGGFAVLSRSQIGRWLGIGAAIIGALGAITWMPYYPVWSLVYILIASAVTYALTMYGGLVNENT